MSDALMEPEQLRQAAPKGVIAGHPWWWFFLVALVPTVVVSLPGSLSYVFTIDVAGFAVFAALLVAWACETGEKAPRRSAVRLAVFAAVLAVWLAVIWALNGTAQDAVLVLPAAVFTASAVAAVYSPTGALRELARPLFRLRADSAAWAVALLAWPLLAALGVLIVRAGVVHPASLVDPWGRGQLDLLLGGLASAVFMGLPTAIAWYGFAARRLLRRLSPLVTALIVGALPWLAVVLPLSIWSTPFNSFVLQTVLGAIVVTVVGVWVYRRSPASLLPVTAFLVLAYAVPSIVLFWAGPRFAIGESVDWLMLALHGLLALALIAQGRMWRRPDATRPESVAVAPGRDA